MRYLVLVYNNSGITHKLITDPCFSRKAWACVPGVIRDAHGERSHVLEEGGVESSFPTQVLYTTTKWVRRLVSKTEVTWCKQNIFICLLLLL